MNVKLTGIQKKIKLASPQTVALVMQQILKRENKLGRSQEHFWVVGLDNANKILFIELIGLGRQNRVTANPPDVFRMAIYKLALKLILVHNHPSGELEPSRADKAFTDRILKVGEIISVDVIDHLIISETAHYSFADEGLMQQFKESDTWTIIEKEELEMREFKKKLDEKRIKKENSMEIAKKLKTAGMDDETIRHMTSLRLSEIKKL